MYKYLTSEFHSMEKEELIQRLFYEEFEVPLFVETEEINSLEEFKNLIDVEEFWGVEDFSISIYVYGFFHRNEVLNFLERKIEVNGELIVENINYSKIAYEIRYNTFILDHKEKVVQYLQENVKFSANIIKEINKSTKCIFLINEHTVHINSNFSFSCDAIFNENEQLDSNHYFPALLIKTLIEENRMCDFTFGDEELISFRLERDCMTIGGNTHFHINLTEFNKPLILKTLQDVHNKQIMFVKKIIVEEIAEIYGLDNFTFEDIINIPVPELARITFVDPEYLQLVKNWAVAFENDNMFTNQNVIETFNIRFIRIPLPDETSSEEI